MRSTAPWMIVVLGVIAFVLVTIFMLVTLEQFKESSAAGFVKLSNAVRNHFSLDSASTSLLKTGEGPVLDVEYQITRADDIDPEARKEEMDNIARYAIEQYLGEDKTVIDTIRVTRQERRAGRADPLSTHTLDFSNPLKPRNTNPYDIDDEE